MQLAKIMLAAFFTTMLGLSPVLADGNLWLDEHTKIPATKYKKIVLFPIRGKDEQDGSPDEYQGYNNYLHKEVNKRIKKTNFLGFGAQLEEKKHILRDNPQFDALTKHFPSEKDRARAVYDATAADGYLLPHIRWEQVRTDVSPATPTRVRLESFYNIINGPYGNRYRVGYRTWSVPYVIPRSERQLQMLDMDFTLYDAYTGKKAMTRIDYYRNYDVDQWHGFKQITRHLTKDWAHLRKGKKQKPKKGAPTLGFRNFTLPTSASNNEFAIKTIYYAIKDEANDTLDEVNVVDTDQTDYYVTGEVTQYVRGQTWHPPYATSIPSHVGTDSFLWYDRQGKKHIGYREYYRTQPGDIINHYGYYSFWYGVAMNLRLVDTKTGQTIYAMSDTDSDPDYFADALRRILHKFYKEVDDRLEKK